MSTPAFDLAAARELFHAETAEQLALLEQGLLSLEAAPGDRAVLDEVFRAAHTIKGAAGMFGHERLVDIAHGLESVLDAAREGALRVDRAIADRLLGAADLLRLRLHAVATDNDADAPPDATERALLAALSADARTAPVAALPTRSVIVAPAAARRLRMRVRLHDDVYRDGIDPLSIVDYLRSLGTLHRCALQPVLDGADDYDPESCRLGFELELESDRPLAELEEAFDFVREGSDLLIEEIGAAAARTPATGLACAPAPPAAADARWVRVPAARLDALVDLVGELLMADAGLQADARRLGDAALQARADAASGLVETLRDRALSLRMVPVGESFARFRRSVRDLSAQLGKEVRLETAGQDTEIDKSLAEPLADALMHLVRNAIDHGLETPAERIAAGKPPQGTVWLEACHEGGQVVIDVRDDGRGLDREAVLARAVERGLVAPGVALSDEAVHALVFEPGFSTARAVTDLSGRGVGMDVVRRNVEAVRGSVTLDSRPGEGTRARIRLPLTLAMIGGFLVQAGGTHFVLPLDQVHECLDPGEALDAAGRTRLLPLRGAALPWLRLSDLLPGARGPATRESVVVVRRGDARFGVVVDRLLGSQQVVIRPLPAALRGCRALAGATVLGNGDVALVVDGAGLPGAIDRLVPSSFLECSE